jgi:hypothetical protein
VTTVGLVDLVGDLTVTCVDGVERRYISLDAAASAPALPAVADQVHEFLTWCSSVLRASA